MHLRGLLLALFLAPLLIVPSPAGDGPADGYVPGQMEKPSDQPGGGACWHYLRGSMRPPRDSVCALCARGGACEKRSRPKGAKAACWGNPDDECFWKRHAWSWGLACSQCWADEECPTCDEAIGGRDAKVRTMLRRQLEIEGNYAGKRLWVVVSPHFYVVTDIHRKLKVPTDGGAPRLATGHEVAHLYAQRCEMAYRDFVHYFGSHPSLGKPMAVLLYRSKSTKEAAAARYLGSPRTNMLYGGGSDRISGGWRATVSSAASRT